MPKSITIKKPQKKISIGDMRDKIIIQLRSLTAPTGTGVDISETLDNNKCVWSMVQTRTGVEIFDGTGTQLKGIATHYFYIRYLKGLTAEAWVTYKDNLYDILDIQNFDERNDFQLLRCSLRGTADNLANQA